MTVGEETSGGQNATEGELSLFIGEKSWYYLPRFKKFSVDGVNKFVFSWNWAGLIAGPFWALYRKMYLYGVVGFLILFMPHISLLPYLMAAVAGNYLYWLHAKSRIAEIRKESSNTDVFHGSLKQEGGVNRWMIVLSWILFIIFIAMMVGGSLLFREILERFYGSGTISI
ncbi:MAG: hypothetical protein ACM3ON_11320 [Chloroflexota bacterium]